MQTVNTDGDGDDTQKSLSKREKLYSQIIDAVNRLRHVFPSLAEHLDEIGYDSSINPEAPEYHSLPLPSQFSAEVQSSYDLVNAARIELMLWKEKACEALEQVRVNVLSHCANSRLRHDKIHGQYENTRAQKFLAGLLQQARKAGRRYNYIRSRLVALGIRDDDSEFLPLDIQNDLWIKDPSKP